MVAILIFTFVNMHKGLRAETFYTLTHAGTDIRLVRFQGDHGQGFIKTYEACVLDLAKSQLTNHRVYTAELSPNGRWLAIGTGSRPSNKSDEPLHSYERTLTIVDMRTFKIAFQHRERLYGVGRWFAWLSGNRLFFEREAEPNGYYAFTLSGPKWQGTETRLGSKPSSKPFPIKPDKLREAHVKSAAKRLYELEYDPPNLGGDLGADPWENHLNRHIGDVSADGEAIAVLAGPDRKQKPSRNHLVFIRQKDQWRESRLTDTEPVWMVRFWKDWLVLGVLDSHKTQSLRLLRMNDLTIELETSGEFFLPVER